NHVRPHEALKGKVPADLYVSRGRKDIRPIRFAYPSHWLVRSVDASGKNCVHNTMYRIGRAFCRHLVALEPTATLRYRAWVHEVLLGELEVTPSAGEIVAMLTTKQKPAPVKRAIRDRSGRDRKRSGHRGEKRPARRGSKGPRAGQAA